MINNKKIVVVMPAYNVAETLEATFNEIDKNIVDEVILVDDFSHDNTVEISQKLGITTIIHSKNMGYGANQKTCYTAALGRNADIIILLHPDYQYTPKLIAAMAAMIAYGEYDFVIASRMLMKSALAGGMPLYKFFANKFLTFFQNMLLGERLSEYHTGYKAYSKDVLLSLPLAECKDDFIFDNEILTLALYYNYKVGEISCPAKYFEEASTMSFLKCCKYGLEVIKTSIDYILAKTGLYKSKKFKKNARKLDLFTELNYISK